MIRNPCFLLLLAAVVGCPTSDDITEVYDGGNKRLDSLIPVDGSEGGVDPGGTTDPVEKDTDQPPPDIDQGCTNSNECQGVFPDLELCVVAVCDTDAGKCVVESAQNGSPCDDDNACTETECKVGKCAVTGEIQCDDGNECTADHCIPEVGCQSITTLLPCDDGDPCTVDDTCHEGLCKPGPDVGCEPGTEANPGTSCLAIQKEFPEVTSGVYWLKPKKDSTPFKVYCENTIANGGWTRVAATAADQPICSYVDGVGSTDVLLAAKPTATSILPLSLTSTIEMETKEIMVTLGQGFYVFRSTHPSWNWSDVAKGTINLANSNNYTVEGSANGADFVPLVAIAPSGKGPHLLGGNQAGGGTSPFLGIGAFHSAQFDQKTCESSFKGLYSGTTFQPTGWNAPGAVYIR